MKLIQADEVRSGRGGKTKGEKYGKYAVAIQKSVPWIKESITNADGGMIRIKTKEMGEEMGGEFVKKNTVSIYWALKYVLFQEGIVVDTATHKDGGKLLVMRFGTADDKLPPSLSKYLEQDEEDAEVPEAE